MITVKKRNDDAVVVANVCEKGGVGKTTTSLALAACFVDEGYKTLLVDYDPQNSTTSCLGYGVEDKEYDGPITEEMLLQDDPETYGISILMEDSLLRMPEMDWHELVIHTREGYDLIPASIELAKTESKMRNTDQCRKSEEVLKRALRRIRKEYDFIIIDCAPTLSMLFTNVITAADKVIIPISPEQSAIRGFVLLYREIHEAKELLNPEIEIAGVLITKARDQANIIKDNIGRIRKLSGTVNVFEDVIPLGIKDAEEATKNNTSLIGLYHGTRRPSPVLTKIAEAYKKVAKEIIDGSNY